MTIKIGLMGTHSGGKTTAWYELASKLKQLHYTVRTVAEAATIAKDNGWDLDTKADGKTQMWILAEHMQNELTAMKYPVDFIITDRTPFDCLAYARSNPKITSQEYQLMSFIANMWAEIYPYDLLIYFPPRDELPQADGVRETNPDWQKRIHEQFLQLLPELGVPAYVCQSGDREGRTNEVLNEVKSRFARRKI